MSPDASKKISVVETQTSFKLWGWVFAIALLLGGVLGGVALWRRAQSAGQVIRSGIEEAIKSKRREAPVVQEVPDPSAEPAERPADPEPAEPAEAPTAEETAQGSQARGSLDRLIIQRIVRTKVNQVKGCYEQELRARPGLEGRVMLRFTIGKDGRVVSSEVQSSTLGNAKVEACVAQKALGWLFPRPRGPGNMVVVYPFLFSSQH